MFVSKMTGEGFPVEIGLVDVASSLLPSFNPYLARIFCAISCAGFTLLSGLIVLSIQIISF